jgi:signal transduction histidine kinase/ActR/RegA family two-component response regulator
MALEQLNRAKGTSYGAEFGRELAPTERSRTIVALSIGAVLYFLFGLLDLVIYPDHLLPLLLIRGIVLITLFFLIVLTLRSAAYLGTVLTAAVGLAVPASGVAIMCHLTEGLMSPYYAGIPLCFVFVAALCTWPVWLMLLSFSVPLASYYVPFLFGIGSSDIRLLALNSSFLLGTTFLVLVGMHLRNRLARQLFTNRVELAQRKRELSELHELKDRMFENVSHELRTPLTLILTPLRRKLDNPAELSPEELQLTSEMFQQGMRLSRQINDLLDLGRLSSSVLPVARRAVDVGKTLKELVDTVQAAASASDLSVELRLGKGSLIFELDPAHLEKIVFNLLGNALKFTPSGGRISVEAEGGKAGLDIVVQDSGIGIAQEDQDRIFDRFQQLDSDTTRRYGGSGIGLALVSELAGAMGGRVKVESELGKGARFTVHFPPELSSELLDEPEVGEGDRRYRVGVSYPANFEIEHRASEREKRLVAGRRGPKVLVVEDDPALRRQLVQLLAEDHRVVGVADGGEALKEALLLSPQVIITDIMMPGLDGVELCRRLRERTEMKNTAVIMLTAKGLLEDRVEGRRAGADSYLTKPFEPTELLATVEGLLRSRMLLVGSFLVQRRLGRGGQSQVWLAEHWRTGEPVALKLVRAGRFEEGRAWSRLGREHSALTRLGHPNIVRLVEHGRESDHSFLALEYLEGVTVDGIIKASGSLEPGVAAAVGQSVAQALAYVHSTGFVHGDVKCSNIMILREGRQLEKRVKLIDFGSADRLGGSAERRERHLGTMSYLAPEMLFERVKASQRTDVYGLGVSLFRMCTGRFPFAGETARGVSESTLGGRSPRVRDIEPEVPAGLEQAIARAIEPDPRVRWASAEAFAEALAPYADNSGEPVLPAVSESATVITTTATAVSDAVSSSKV